MKILRHFIQLLGMALAIFILYHIKVEVLLPYILPVTLIGVVSILSFAFIVLKRRGLLSLIFLLLPTVFMTYPGYAAEQLLPCAHNGKSAVTQLLQAKNKTEAALAMGDLAQEKVGGNVTTNDFANDLTQACVIVNCINAAAELKGQTMDCEADYDPKMRQNAIYIVENVGHMNVTSARRDIDGDIFTTSWMHDEILQSNNSELKRALTRSENVSNIKDAIDARDIAQEYLEHCACVDKKREKNCRTIAETVAKNSQDCWVCSIVEAMLLATQKIASVANIVLIDFSLGLLGVMFLLWIAIKVLHLIGTLGYGDHNSFFTEFLFRTIAVVIAAAILHAPLTELYRIAISPFIMATTGFTEELTDAVLTDENGSFYEQVKRQLNSPQLDQNNPKRNCMLHCKNMMDEKFTYTQQQIDLMGGEPGVIDPQSYSALLCLTCRTYNQMIPFTAIGEAMTCYSFSHGWIPWFLDVLFPLFSYWFMGAAFIIAFSLLMTVIAFYILDIVLKLAFIIILTPLFVAAWAFPISREYTSKAWNMILYALFEFIGVALMVSIFMVLVMNILGDLPVSEGDIEATIISAMKRNDVPALFELMGGNGPWTLLKLIVVCLMGYKMITASGQVVSALSDISPGIPGVAMGTLAGVAKGAIELAGMSTVAAGKIGGKAVKKVGGKIGDATKKGAGEIDKIAQSRNASSKGQFKSDGPTNTRQAAAKGLDSFSEKSRQAGLDMKKAGENRKAQGEALSAKGREMAAKGGLGHKLKGNLMRAQGALNRGLGGVTAGIGNMKNKAGQGVADLLDKSDIANKLKNSGDAAQQRKEESLKANPDDAARRERGYNRISEGASAIRQNMSVAKGAYLMASGLASVARSKITRGIKNMSRKGKRDD